MSQRGILAEPAVQISVALGNIESEQHADNPNTPSADEFNKFFETFRKSSPELFGEFVELMAKFADERNMGSLYAAGALLHNVKGLNHEKQS